MVQAYWYLREKVMRFITGAELGQDAVEYLLVSGAVVVVVVLAAATAANSGMFAAIVSGVCSKIATLPGFGSVSC